MQTGLGSIAIFSVISAMFLVELASGTIGNDAGLLALGALPDDGQMHLEYWRLITFGFLHSNVTHFLLNCLLLLLVGPVVERRVGSNWLLVMFLTASVASGVGILVKHQIWPTDGASVGASGGLFGLLAAALVILFRLPDQTFRVKLGLLFVLIAGLSYSMFPGISMIGHVIGLLVGAIIAVAIPLGQQIRST